MIGGCGAWCCQSARRSSENRGQQNTGLSVHPDDPRPFSPSALRGVQLSLIRQNLSRTMMTTTTPDTTRYFPHPAQFPSHTNEQYLEEAHGIASQCWLHYADPNSRSYGTLYTGALGSLCYLRLRFADVLPGKGITLKALACVDDALAQATRRSVRCTFLECPTTSSLCLKLALLVKVDQIDEARSIGNEILRLGQSCRSPVECLDASECEILYLGTAGLDI